MWFPACTQTFMLLCLYVNSPCSYLPIPVVSMHVYISLKYVLSIATQLYICTQPCSITCSQLPSHLYQCALQHVLCLYLVPIPSLLCVLVFHAYLVSTYSPACIHAMSTLLHIAIPIAIAIQLATQVASCFLHAQLHNMPIGNQNTLKCILTPPLFTLRYHCLCSTLQQGYL